MALKPDEFLSGMCRNCLSKKKDRDLNNTLSQLDTHQAADWVGIEIYDFEQLGVPSVRNVSGTRTYQIETLHAFLFGVEYG